MGDAALLRLPLVLSWMEWDVETRLISREILHIFRILPHFLSISFLHQKIDMGLDHVQFSRVASQFVVD